MKKKKNIGIVTLYTGFNYGSALQAFSSKIFYEKLGYESEILSYSNSLIKGRDIRIEKLLIMFLRTFWRPKLFKKTFLIYKNKLSKNISKESKNKFLNFYEEYLKPIKMNKKEMKIHGSKDDVLAVICGSDQIWSSTSVYVDPFYYLRFFPKNKRIAYAPSFGKNYVPNYNKKILTKYINEIDYLSVREIDGQKIIKELTGKDSQVLIDPTLLLSCAEWKEIIKIERLVKDKYILLYFLDIPSDISIENLKNLLEKENKKIIIIPNLYEKLKELNKNIETLDAGPLEFLNLVLNAEFICTDSFHGMIFSINFNKEFYIFERNYGSSDKQSSRITSMLEILNLKDRYIKDNISNLKKIISWDKVNEELDKQREKSKKYLLNCFRKIEEKNGE